MESENLISQYVSNVLSFTSEYSEVQWRALNLIGPPTSNSIYGDNSNSWCPGASNEDQVLELQFELAVYISRIKIYENYNGGAVTKIEALNLNTNLYENLWSRDLPVISQYYSIFSPIFQSTLFQTNQIKLTLTQSDRNLFSEIEAVELIGTVINLEIPKKSLIDDIKSLFNNKLYSDLEIGLYNNMTRIETLHCHKNIIAIRSEKLFKFIEMNKNEIKFLNGSDVKLLLEYVYSDHLNELMLKKVIEDECVKSLLESESLPLIINDGHSLDFESVGEKWILVINNLVRHTIRFELKRMEKLLLNYLINHFIDLNNSLNILLDALDGVNFADLPDFDIETKFRLEKVEEICLGFIKVHIKQIIKLEKFALLPKDVLIKIVRTL